MEYAEALEVAKSEIVFMKGEEERARVRMEMKRDAHQREVRQEWADKRSADAAARKASSDRAHASLVIALACRRWRARRALGGECLDNYEKLFDAEHHAFYYRNKRTVSGLRAPQGSRPSTTYI